MIPAPLQIPFVLALVVAASVVLIADRLRPDLVALLLLVSLGLTGMVRADDLFAGFSRSAVITIIALFIITEGLERTGATRILGQRLQRVAGGSEARAVLVVMLSAAALSLVMNTIAAAAVLLPAVIGITRQTSLRPSRLLMPLSFGALLGGMATLFTTANILVSAALDEHGYRPYGVLDFLPVGAPMALLGVLFMAFVGRRLLPERALGGRQEARRATRDLSEAYGMREAVYAAYVRPGSAMAGLSLSEGQWGERMGLNILGISRGGSVNLAPEPEEEILEGDVVLFTGFTDEEELSRYGLNFTEDPAWQGQLASAQVSLVEAVLAPRSALAGKTLREIQFREKYELSVLAIWREGNTLRDGLADIPLRFGDALLIQGRRLKLQLLRDDPNFLILEEEGEVEVPRKAWLAVALTTAAVLLPVFTRLPIAESTLTAASLMLLFNCLTMDQAYSAIEWKAVFLIAGMIPLGLAMRDSGAAALIGNGLVEALGGWGPLAVAGGIFIAATLITQVLSGQVTPLVLAPIAIAAAQHLGVDPRGMAMAVAMGCSTAFLTPISHSANMLVMGPGGYKFKDYARAGLPLTALLFVVLLAGLAVFWNIR
jgi:di/tricarboxylate transporter